jgi:hypothetical protein
MAADVQRSIAAPHGAGAPVEKGLKRKEGSP